MSKDKGERNLKKAPATGNKKALSDYQAGKKLTSDNNLISNKKTK